MSPILQRMKLQARLHGISKSVKCEEARSILRKSIERLDKEIDALIIEQNAQIKKKLEAKYGPSTNTYSDDTVEFEDAMGYRFN